jgi:hypothetical protein
MTRLEKIQVGLIAGLSTLVVGLYALIYPGAVQEWVASKIPPNTYLFP